MRNYFYKIFMGLIVLMLSSCQSASATLLPTIDSTTPTPGVGSMMTSEKDHMTLLYVPEGAFTMGSLDVGPIHLVYLDGFWIDKTEVTNIQYEICVNARACAPPTKTKSYTHDYYYGNPEFSLFPVIFVNWNMAITYCKWAGRRLPTEAEWEKAARGTDERNYPWGNEPPNRHFLNFSSQIGDTTEVGMYPDGASFYGVLDMSGNVWEWVNDWYSDSYYENSPMSNPFGPSSGTYRIIRGGSWNYWDENVRSVARFGIDPVDSIKSIGFRCANSK